MCIVFEGGVAMGLYGQALVTFTIHGMAKRSVTMPKPADQKVAANGMATVPPAANASNTRWPSATLPTPYGNPQALWLLVATATGLCIHAFNRRQSV